VPSDIPAVVEFPLCQKGEVRKEAGKGKRRSRKLVGGKTFLKINQRRVLEVEGDEKKRQ